MDNITLSVEILLAGFIVVFAVLLLLIGIIKLYGTIVYNIQNRPKKVKEEVKEVKEEVQVQSVESFSNSLSGEVIAVISAAVDSLYGPSSVKIKSIKKTQNQKNAWRTVGVTDNTRPF